MATAENHHSERDEAAYNAVLDRLIGFIGDLERERDAAGAARQVDAVDYRERDEAVYNAVLDRLIQIVTDLVIQREDAERARADAERAQNTLAQIEAILAGADED